MQQSPRGHLQTAHMHPSTLEYPGMPCNPLSDSIYCYSKQSLKTATRKFLQLSVLLLSIIVFPCYNVHKILWISLVHKRMLKWYNSFSKWLIFKEATVLCLPGSASLPLSLLSISGHCLVSSCLLWTWSVTVSSPGLSLPIGWGGSANPVRMRSLVP